ncbi:uncharacterized protein C8Q71DRAFT_721940 [Rhodofomes roseus]|uniref:Uncharacterized protein n=1 Tax=Rhodofomes roseus TaxID=34475 RepID=A0ABQ8KP73_9APHY|nr:uncharacterized protein C8Q71DRAFT_721940 [Rhodofomes roseus]KAH9840228.1 hypothetical protein C8Q71DRAFT_721940 [Rhodofomes roseus]
MQWCPSAAAACPSQPLTRALSCCSSSGLCKTWVVRLPNGAYKYMSAYTDYFGQVWTDYFYYWPYDYPKDSSLLGWDNNLWEQGVDMMLATHKVCLQVEEHLGMY